MKMSIALTRKFRVTESPENILVNHSSVLERMVSMLTRSFGIQHVGVETALRIDEKLSLGPKKTLFLVACSGKQFLVATGADTIVSMVEVTAPGHQDRTAAKFLKPNKRRWQKQEQAQ
jgi:flagellar biogenesis protein FliO